MPRYSSKALLQRDLFNAFLLSFAEIDLLSLNDIDTTMLFLILHEAIAEKRYLFPRERVPKFPWFNLVLPELSSSRFRLFARMDRESFHYVLSLIKDDPIFSNDSFCPQAPIDVQLHLALYKLGNDGNASAYKPSATLWGVSEGHFFNCTYRVVTALYRLRNRVICWPDEIARRRESMINHDRGGFIGAVGKLDGTDIVLENKPGK